MKNFELKGATFNELGNQARKLVDDNPDETFYVNITKKKSKRSLSANAVQWVWATKISEFTNTDVKTCANELKVDFGVPILLRDPEIGRVLGHALQSAGFFTMTRERQVKFIEVIQVTSLMNTQQHHQYRENVMYYYGQQGLILEYKEL